MFPTFEFKNVPRCHRHAPIIQRHLAARSPSVLTQLQQSSCTTTGDVTVPSTLVLHEFLGARWFPSNPFTPIVLGTLLARTVQKQSEFADDPAVSEMLRKSQT